MQFHKMLVLSSKIKTFVDIAVISLYVSQSHFVDTVKVGTSVRTALGAHVQQTKSAMQVESILSFLLSRQSCQPVTFKKSIIELKKTYFEVKKKYFCSAHHEMQASRLPRAPGSTLGFQVLWGL